jgi:hypothetical protein
MTAKEIPHQKVSESPEIFITDDSIVNNGRGLKKKGVATFLKSLIYQYAFHFIGLHCKKQW